MTSMGSSILLSVITNGVASRPRLGELPPHATVGMFELPMTALGLPQKVEAQLFQSADEFARFDVRQIGVAHTVTST